MKVEGFGLVLFTTVGLFVQWVGGNVGVEGREGVPGGRGPFVGI